MQVEILVPTTGKDITLGQYQKYASIETEENKNTPFILQKMLEIFCSVDLKDVAKVKYTDLLSISQTINKILNKEYPLTERFTLDNVEYGFIPLLEDISLGEYIDLDTNFSDWKSMNKAMSVLYRPVVDQRDNRYTIQEYEGTNNQLKEMPIDIVLGAVVFFYRLSQELLTATLNYLAMGDKLVKEQEEVLEKNGVGINQSMHLLKETLQSLNISLN